MNLITSVETTSLTLHPLQSKVYGDEPVDTKLAESIRMHGILSPLLIDSNNQILSGTRRWKAARELGLPHVPAIRFEGSALDAEQALIEANRQREKTAGQKARETAELFRIEKALAAVRRASTLIQNVPDTVPPSQGVSGETREIVAQKTGQSKSTVEKQVAIVTRAGAGDETAQCALKELDANNISVSRAYHMVMEPAKAPAQEKEPAQEKKSPVARQMERVESVLNGIDIGMLRNAVEHLIAAPYDQRLANMLVAVLRTKVDELCLCARALEERRIHW